VTPKDILILFRYKIDDKIIKIAEASGRTVKGHCFGNARKI